MRNESKPGKEVELISRPVTAGSNINPCSVSKNGLLLLSHNTGQPELTELMVLCVLDSQ